MRLPNGTDNLYQSYYIIRITTRAVTEGDPYNIDIVRIT